MDPAALSVQIIKKALELGADDAGVCLARDLLRGPTHQKFPLPDGIEDHQSVLVLALDHPPGKPELDYYVKKDGFRFGNSIGNKKLMDISNCIGRWLNNEGFISRDLHYYVESGGVFLKGAAVLAGLGRVGINNLFIHPGYGARIRLRAHLVDTHLMPSDPLDFDPCRGCEKPCLDVCPAKALDEEGYHLSKCQNYMDRKAAGTPLLPADDNGPMRRETHCCRACEFACSFTGTLEHSAN